jgi:class 3 adenylate cyclase
MIHRNTMIIAGLSIVLVAGLPVAVWMDLKDLSETQLNRQAADISRIIDGVRDFYATDVVARVRASDGHVTTSHVYKTIPGAIPIPATFSLELGAIVGAKSGDIEYRFVSDYPFRGRESHQLDPFEAQGLATLRADPGSVVTEVAGTLFDRKVRLLTPVLMKQACVDCHNSHPESPKQDWKVGDVRGVQSITVHQRVDDNLFAFRSLLVYLLLLAASGLAFIALQFRLASRIAHVNKDLKEANDFLASISMKIRRYISPQVYNSIFSGQIDASIKTSRKKLTIFFSDIQNFTSTTEEMQPEDLTQVLNEYFTEMDRIATAHGGTLDKFIGDAVLVFFGDPETKGVREDAVACVRMAQEMQDRIVELGAIWRARGVERPFRARMGINTGYCNVGNFGSVDRMDYTIIGAEANLAARLQQTAEPGGIVVSYETYAHVKDIVKAQELEPIHMKGISRAIIPYAVTVVDTGRHTEPAVGDPPPPQP